MYWTGPLVLHLFSRHSFPRGRTTSHTETELRDPSGGIGQVGKTMLTWPPNLSLFSPSNDGQCPATSESHAVPGSLRDAHYAASAWFLGPKAENADYLKMFVETILADLTQCRRNFAPEDEVSTTSMSSSLLDELIKIGHIGLHRHKNRLVTHIHKKYV
jgi:hypothetical protein